MYTLHIIISMFSSDLSTSECQLIFQVKVIITICYERNERSSIQMAGLEYVRNIFNLLKKYCSQCTFLTHRLDINNISTKNMNI